MSIDAVSYLPLRYLNCMTLEALKQDLTKCTLCADRFAATHTRHRPNPVVWFDQDARILLCSQAPGMRAHKGTRPFIDPSGDRLRDWLGMDMEAFYDRRNLAIVPMGFCFPGYDAKGSDLPPPKLCAATWREKIFERLTPPRLTLLIGGYAQDWHLGKGKVTDRVAAWRTYAPHIFPLPHPSWRNTAWMKRHPWFEAETLPALKSAVKDALA